MTDLLLDAVFVEAKIFPRQVVDDGAVLIANGRLDHHQIHIRLQPEPLRLSCHGRRANGWGRGVLWG